MLGPVFMQLDFKLLFSTIKFSWKSLHAIASLRGFFFTLKMHMIKLQWMCYKTTIKLSSLVSSLFTFHPNKSRLKHVLYVIICNAIIIPEP